MINQIIFGPTLKTPATGMKEVTPTKSSINEKLF